MIIVDEKIPKLGHSFENGEFTLYAVYNNILKKCHQYRHSVKDIPVMIDVSYNEMKNKFDTSGVRIFMHRQKVIEDYRLN